MAAAGIFFTCFVDVQHLVIHVYSLIVFTQQENVFGLFRY